MSCSTTFVHFRLLFSHPTSYPVNSCKMSAHITMESQPHYLILIQSTTGKLSYMLLAVPDDLDPESFAKTIVAAYKLEFSKFRRLYYRCVLLKKPVVSIVSLGKASSLSFFSTFDFAVLTRCKKILTNCPQTTNFTSGSNLRDKLVIKASVEDQTLTSAMKCSSVLGKINPESFFGKYEAATTDEDGNAPEKAIMIHLARDDKLAARVTGAIMTLTVSIAAKVLDTLVMGS